MKHLILPALLALAPMPAAAQGVAHGDCLSKALAVQTLFEEYNETPVWAGNSDYASGALILASPGGSWTMLRVYEGDVVCIVTSGIGYMTPDGQVGP